MSTLHLVFSLDGARHCLAAGVRDRIVLIADGVYAFDQLALPGDVRVLLEDLAQRGLTSTEAHVISMKDLVGLTVDNARSVSWR